MRSVRTRMSGCRVSAMWIALALLPNNISAEEDRVQVIAADGKVGTIAPGEVHARDVELGIGFFYHFIVEQQGIDLKLVLRAPDDRVVWEADGSNGAHGPEELMVLTEVPGLYRVELVALDGGSVAGRYVVEERARRLAREADHLLVEDDHADHELRYRARARPHEVIERLEPVARRWAERDLYRREAETLDTLARAYLETGRLAEALTAIDRSILWYDSAGADLQLSAALRLAGEIRLRGPSPASAVEVLRRARQVCANLGNPADEAATLAYLAWAEIAAGRYQAALDLVAEAEALAERVGKPQILGIALNGAAWALLDLGRSQEALEFGRKGARLAETHGKPRVAMVSWSIQAEALWQSKSFEEALAAANRALEIAREHGLSERYGPLSSLGNVLRESGRASEAERVYDEALSNAHEHGATTAEAEILVSLAQVHLQTERPARALELQEAALKRIGDQGGLRLRATIEARSAQSLSALGQAEEAWERMRSALEAIDTIHAEVLRRDRRMSYRAARQDYHEMALDLLFDLHTKAPDQGWAGRALAIHDRYQARELRADWARRPAGLESRISADLRQREDDLLARLAKLASASSTTEPRPKIRKVLSELEEVRGAIVREVDMIGATKSEEVLEADLEVIQKTLLDKSTALLVFALGEETSRLWVVTQDGLRVERLAGRAALEDLAVDFARSVRAARTRDTSELEWRGKKLYEALLGKVGESFFGRSRLVLSLDGALWDVPFEALPFPERGKKEMLVELFELPRIPSVAALLTLHRRRSGSASTEHGKSDRPWLTIFADPVLDPVDVRLGEVVGEAESSLPEPLLGFADRLSKPPERLSWSGHEANRIAAYFDPAKVVRVCGFKVDRKAFLDRFERGGTIFHLATHALVHDDPALSALVFSIFDRDGRVRNELVRSADISAIKLRSMPEMVVLSACETGVGERIAGEGALSLSRAFLHAGVPRVVASKWMVSDQRTAELMIDFYRFLAQKLSPAAALRAAQRGMIEREEPVPPSFWASFHLEGDWRKLYARGAGDVGVARDDIGTPPSDDGQPVPVRSGLVPGGPEDKQDEGACDEPSGK